MKSFEFNRYALSACAAMAMLVGCGGSQPPIGAPGAIPQTSGVAAHAEPGKSWMLPEAKSEDLLYVTNYSDVLVLSYPQGKLVGTLKDFHSASGACIDSTGDVFVTNFKPVTVYEYAHGGTKRIASFPTKKAGTFGCAVNPVNGNLAITGQTSYVEIFKGARGKPIVLQDKGMFFGQFCTYDDKGNLFFDGLQNPKGKPRLSELPAGSSKFTAISVNATLDSEAGIEWDGRYLTALSYVTPRAKQSKPVILRIDIDGSRGTEIGATPLDKPAYSIVQYFITKGTLIVPNLGSLSSGDKEVLFYKYPRGGAPTTQWTKHITDPRGVVLSAASD